MRFHTAFTAAAAAVALTGTASAATFDFTGSGGSATSYDFSAGGEVNVHVVGIKLQWNGNGWVTNWSGVGQWQYGLGVQSSGDSEHTVDNNGYRDVLIFQFDRAVSLGQATFNTGFGTPGNNNDGWYGFNDTDATIGLAQVDYSALGKTYADTSAAIFNAAAGQLGASAYGSGSVGESGNSTRFVGNGSYGNVWMIAAALDNPDSHKDSFKLGSLEVTMPIDVTPGVPEPTSWAMLILGLGGVGGAMRRRAAAARTARAAIRFA